MKAEGGWDYTPSFVKKEHVVFDPGFGRALVDFLGETTVNDFGAGVGQLGWFISKQNAPIEWHGWDGGSNIENLVGKHMPVRGDETHHVPPMCFIDLSKPFHVAPAPWVISIEVGEHIPEPYESVFLNNLVNHATKGIILSWAVEGQGGFQHVNTKNNVHVIRSLKKMGFKYNFTQTRKFRRSVTDHWWLRNTIMVFERSYI